MKLQEKLVEVFVKCESCKEMVPAGNYCSRCGTRHKTEIEIRMLAFNEQRKCPYCGATIWKKENCSNCGILLER